MLYTTTRKHTYHAISYGQKKKTLHPLWFFFARRALEINGRFATPYHDLHFFRKAITPHPPTSNPSLIGATFHHIPRGSFVVSTLLPDTTRADTVAHLTVLRFYLPRILVEVRCFRENVLERTAHRRDPLPLLLACVLPEGVPHEVMVKRLPLDRLCIHVMHRRVVNDVLDRTSLLSDPSNNRVTLDPICFLLLLRIAGTSVYSRGDCTEEA